MKCTWLLIVSINLHQHYSMKDIWGRANCAFKPATYKNFHVIIHSDDAINLKRALLLFLRRKKKALIPAPFMCLHVACL